MTPYSHCHFCGAAYESEAWPRTCPSCGNLTYSNPTPVAVALTPVGDERPQEAKRTRVLSGITPSGSLTLGNYLGALRRFVAGQYDDTGRGDTSQARFFFVADLHALTTDHDPQRLRELTTQTAALFFASGS